MIKLLRKNDLARDIIIFLVCAAMAAYVLVGMGSGSSVTAPENTITKVGDTKIRNLDATMATRRYRNYFNENTGWSGVAGLILDQSILLNDARNMGLAVSDSELRDFVIANRTMADGTFLDEDQWSDTVYRSWGMQVGSFEEYIRNNWLMTDKFRQLLMSAAYVSEEDIVERFSENNRKVELEMMVLNTYDVRNEIDMGDDAKVEAFYNKNKDKFVTGDQRKIQFVVFPVNDYLKDQQVSDEAIRNYYDQNIERYRIQEEVQARHVLIKTDKHSDEEALALINKVKAEIDGGLDFAEAATKYSEDDGTKARGGDLGKFQRGRMVPPFDQAAFSMEVGQISEPIKTQFGYHIIKKEDHTQERLRTFDEVKAAIKSTISRDMATAQANSLAADFRQMITDGAEFSEAAQKNSYTVHESTPFDNDNRSHLGEVLKANAQVRLAVFRLTELNEVTPVINAGPQTVVAKWVEEVEPRNLDISNTDDKARIKSLAENIAGSTLIENIFDEIKAAAAKDPAKSFKDLEGGKRDFIKDNHFRDSGMVTANTIPWELRRDDFDFDKDIYALNVGDFIEGYTSSSDTRFVLARLKSKEEPDMSKLEDERFEIAERLRLESGSEIMANYLYARRGEIDPEGIKEAELTVALGRRR